MFQIVLLPGGVPCEFTQLRAERYNNAVVSEVDGNGKFIRVVAADEYTEWGDEVPVSVKAVTKKKPAKKKKVNKPSAIPNDDSSLENIDVSAL